MKNLTKVAAVACLCTAFAAGSAFADNKKKKDDDPITGIATFVEGIVMLPIQAVEDLLK